MRNLKLVSISFCLLFLSACTTTIDIKLGDKSSAFTLVFKDEAKQAIVEDPESDQKILKLLNKASGRPVERVINNELLSYRTIFDNKLMPSEITSVSINSTNLKTEIIFQKPTKLEDALSKALAGNSAGPVLIETYKKNIIFKVSYSTKNKIIAVNGKNGDEYKHDAHSVIFTYPLDNVPQDVVTINSEKDYAWFYFLSIGMLFLLFVYKYKVKFTKKG